MFLFLQEEERRNLVGQSGQLVCQAIRQHSIRWYYDAIIP
jgi:hypothetical protein